MPHHEVTNPDLARVINSNEIQSAIRNTRKNVVNHEIQKKNPLRNQAVMDNLNPNAKIVRQAAKKANEEGRKRRADRVAAKRGLEGAEKKTCRERKNNSRKWIGQVNNYLAEIYQKAKDEHISNQKLERQIE